MNKRVFVVIVFAFLKVNFVWVIAEEIPFCHYQLEKRIVTFNDSTLNVTLPGKQLYISLCATSIKNTCRGDVSACIVDEIQPQESLNNLGKYFVLMKDQNGNSILKSVNGQRCIATPNKNYTLIIHLDCDDLLKNGPMFVSMQRCEYHIRMLNPECSPKCTTRVGKDNYLLDLQHLEILGDIKVSNSNRTFYVSLCGPATHCGNSYPEYMACELQNNKIHAIATFETQHVNYNDNSGVLSIRGRTEESKSNRKYTELFLKCNWEEVNVKAAFQKIYKGNKYTFQLESRHFCFKLPSKCLVTNRQYLYDISSLNKHGGDRWLVSGLSTNFIYINVCGPLQSLGKCKEQHAQVCLYQRGTDTISLGSIASNLEVTETNSLKLKYKDGSRCNSNETYKTELEFICSEREYGPKIISVDNCTYSFVWNTPSACPNHMVQGENNCNLVEDNGYQRNISEVHTSEDRIIQINKRINFRFNLCGSLVTPCAGVNNKASACLERNGKEYIVGLDNKKLTNLNGKLLLRLENKMQNRMYKVDSSTTVYFHCNYTASIKGDVALNYTRDLKTFILNVYTPLACTPGKVVDCTIQIEDFVIDLSPLSSNKSNYVVNSGDEDYILNVCRSVINTGDDLCPSYSPVCLKKKSEPNLINRYRRFGSVARPEWIENELIIQYKNGGYCKDSIMFETSSVIHFRCSAEEKQPEILRKDYCSVEFVWFTKYACQTPCTMCRFNTSRSVIDLSFMKNEILKLDNENNTYYFNLCHHNYTFCKENDTCVNVESTPEVVLENNNVYIVYKIANNETKFNGMWIELVCDLKVESFLITKKTVMTNNTRHVTLKTNKFCQGEKLKSIQKDFLKPSKNEKDYESIKHAAVPIKENDVIISTNSSLLKSDNVITSNSGSKNTFRLNTDHSSAKLLQKGNHPNNCSIRSPDTHQLLLFTSLSPWNVLGKTANYFVSLASLSPVCNGYICKNKTTLTLPSSNCPEVSFGSSFVRLSYTQYKNCNGEDYRSTILLKCNESGEEGPHVSQEDDCSVEIVFPTKKACKLFNSLPAGGLSLGVIFGIVCGCVFIFIIFLVGIILYRKYIVRHDYNSLCKNEVHPMEKVKKI